MADGSVKFDTKLDSSGLEKGLKGLGVGLGAAVAAIGAGLATAGGAVISTGMEFEKTLSGIAAVSGATTDEMDKLAQLAMDAGADTVFSASEAARGIEELLKAGLSVEQVLGGGLAGALDLASAGEIGLADAAEIASTVLNAFRDDGLSVADAANILAGAANASATDVYGLQLGLSQVAAVASGMGLSFQDTATSLAVFAQNGLKGSDAGTSLKTMLMRLQPTTDKAYAQFEQLGLITTNTAKAFQFLSAQGFEPASQSAEDIEKALQKMAKAELGAGATTSQLNKRMNELRTESGLLQSAFYDMDGKMRPMNEIAELLQTSLKDLTDAERAAALETMFGSDAIRAANILFKEGAEGINEMEAALLGISAAQVAAQRLDNLAGDVEYLKGSVETLGLQLYFTFNDQLRETVQTTTGYMDELIDAFTVGGFDALLDAAGDVLGKILVDVVNFTPKIVDASLRILKTVISTIKGKAKDVSQAAAKVAASFLKGFMEILPDVAELGTEFMLSLIEGAAAELPGLIPLAAEMIAKIAAGLIRAIPRLLAAIPRIAGALIEGFRSIDWAGLWAQLVDAFTAAWDEIKGLWGGLKDYVKQINWSDAWETLKHAADDAWEWIKTSFLTIWEFIKGVDWSAVWGAIKGGFASAGDFLKKQILGDSYTDTSTWTQAGAKIWAAIQSGFVAVGGFLKKLILGDNYAEDSTWADAGKQIWEKIKEGLDAAANFAKALVLGSDYTPDATWGDVGKKIWGTIKAGYESAADWVKAVVLGEDYAPDATWKSAGAKLWESLKAGLEEASDWAKAIILGEHYTPDSTWGDAGKQIWEAIKAGYETAANWIQAIKDSIAGGEGASWADVGGAIVAKIGAALSGIDGETLAAKIGDLSAVAQKIVTKIIEGKADFYAAAGTLIGNLIGAVTSWSGWESLASSFASIASAIVKGIVDGIPSVANAAVDIINAVAGLFTGEGFAGVSEHVAGIAQSLIQGIVDAIPSVSGAAVSIINAIANLFSGEGFENLLGGLSTVAKALIDGIVSALPSMWDAAKQIVIAIGEALAKVPWATIGTELAGLATAIIDGLISAVGGEGSDFGGLITAIGQGIINAVAGLATAAASLVGSLVAYLLDPANLAKIMQVGVSFVGSIVQGILGLGASLIEGAADVLTNTVVGFFRGLFGIQVDPYIEQMQRDFLDTEFDVNARFEELGKASGAALVDAMNGQLTDTESLENAIEAWGITVESGYSRFYPEYEHLGNESIQSLYRGLIHGIETEGAEVELAAAQAALLIGLGYGENLENALYETPVGDALWEMTAGKMIALEPLAQALGYDLGTLMGIDLPEGYAMALQNGEPVIVSTATELMAAGESVIAQGGNLAELMASLWQHVGDTTFAEIDSSFRPALMETLEAMGVAAGDLLGMALPEGVADGLATGTMTVADAAALLVAEAVLTKNKLAEVVSENEAGGKEGGEAVGTGIGTATPEVTIASDTLAQDGIITPLTGLGEDTLPLGEEAAGGLSDGILAGQGELETAVGTVSDAAVQAFLLTLSADNGTQIGTDFTSAIAAAITALSGALQGAAQTAASLAKDSAAWTLSWPVGFSIGSMFGQGIAAGITSETGAIAAAAAAAAQAALDAANAALAIHSPSREAAKIGRRFDEGLAEGIEGSATLAVDEVEALAKALSGELMGGLLTPALEIDIDEAIQRAQAALDREQLHIAAVADMVTNGSLYASGGDASGGMQVVIESIEIHAENANSDQDWREISRQIGLEVARRARQRGVVRA